MSFALDYNELVHLDAEDLAEGGIKSAYDSLLPELRTYVSQPLEIKEVVESGDGSYIVKAGATEFLICTPGVDLEGGRTWGRATYALFSIVNDQLADSGHRFYAFYAGNDLAGMFLTPAQAEAAKQSLPRKTDWPYLPRLEHPWYGQPH